MLDPINAWGENTSTFSEAILSKQVISVNQESPSLQSGECQTATVIWDGQYREVDIAASETEPLLGMAMLYGYRLQVDNVEGGIVKIEAL